MCTVGGASARARAGAGVGTSSPWGDPVRRSRPRNCPRASVSADAGTQARVPVAVGVEAVSWNERRVWARVRVKAPLDAVWGVLSDYANLGHVVPSLAKNVVVSGPEVDPRTGWRKVRLDQAAAQKVAPGLPDFKARVVVDCYEWEDHPRGGSRDASQFGKPPDPANPFAHPLDDLPPAETAASSYAGGEGEGGAVVAILRTWSIPFDMVEGDFSSFNGIWRMEEVFAGVEDGQEEATSWDFETIVSYAVQVKPHPLLPVKLIEGRISDDMVANLEAIRAHVEQIEANGP